jgi:hypothetical protein
LSAGMDTIAGVMKIRLKGIFLSAASAAIIFRFTRNFYVKCSVYRRYSNIHKHAYRNISGANTHAHAHVHAHKHTFSQARRLAQKITRCLAQCCNEPR